MKKEVLVPGRDTERGTTASTSPGPAVARVGLWLLFAAHLAAGWGTQWDVQWHLLIGRDSFWIAPHLMTYGGVAGLVLVSFGVLAWTTARTLAGGRQRGTIGVMGIRGTPGYHLAAWGIALTVLAAPIDDLWHRLFGLDVTLWSPPHLLGLLGGIVSAGACWLIALEAYPEGSRGRLAALVVAGALVYAGIGFGLQPAIRIAYVYGGVRFFTYQILGALLAPLALVVTARLSRLRAAPLLSVLLMVLMAMAGAAVAHAGFAWTEPVSFIAEEIAKDPTSPIALAHEIAQRNGTRPGAMNPSFLTATSLAALVMGAVDARRRPGLASLAYGMALFVAVGIVLARMPAFAQSVPSMLATVVAMVAVALAGLAGGSAARRVTNRISAMPIVSAEPRR